jgi:2-amino-4-hydroxy-6-hydroxymethyldihydropteridine diphosphokinase
MTSNSDLAEIFLSLGSNIHPAENLKAALALLRERCAVVDCSSVYRTPPQGDRNQADFLNMAIQVRTSLSPEQFKTLVIGDIEANNKNAPRTIDLDISLWNDAVLDYGEKPWHIPEPDLIRYAHVAMPLAEIAPDYVHPETGQTLAQIAATLDSSSIERQAKISMTQDNLFIVNPEGAIWRDGRYLVVVRGDEEEHAAGVLSFIGGGADRTDQGDDLLENIVRREIREEVGLEVSDVAYVLSRSFMTGDDMPVAYMLFLCRYQAGDVRISDPGEVAEALWLTPDEILQHPNCPPWAADDIKKVESLRRTLGW